MTEPTGTMWGLIDAAAREHPGRVLFSDDFGRSLTAAQFREAAERVAAGLRLRPGQVVSWQLPPVLEAPVLLGALARVGAVQNPLITMLRERELRLIAGQIGPSLFVAPRTWRGFAHGELAEELAPNVVALDLEESAGDRLRLPMADPGSLPPPPDDPDTERWIYFSSGTTADPKGVRHTDRSVIASSLGMSERLGISDGDVYPIAWAYPHIGGVTMTAAVLRGGGNLVLFDRFDPATTAERMAAHRPTILGTATPFFRTYLDAQKRAGAAPLFPSLRAFTAGGAPTPVELIDELVEVFGVSGVLNSWGLTEFPIATAVAPSDPVEKSLSSVGRPTPGVRVRVVDGELRLKGPQCFSGYVDAGLDAAAFDEDGWFRTGDLGRVDDEGFVHITGRLKEVIIRNAENISASEVESALLRHPDVVEVTVLGLPDPRTGERVCAVVVTASGASLSVEEVGEHCRQLGLARHKTPERVETVPALPRNAMGKVLKQDLRARYATAD